MAKYASKAQEIVTLFFSDLHPRSVPFSRCLPSTQVYEAESNMDNFDVQRSWGWEPTGTLEQMRKELRVSIESTVEKSVMDTQIHKSKV